jgi:hypothetical protein
MKCYPMSQMGGHFRKSAVVSGRSVPSPATDIVSPWLRARVPDSDKSDELVSD